MKFIKKNKWSLLASFLLPLVLMAIILAITGIYWGSSRSILAGDAYHQYVAIHSLYRNILHSGGSQGFLYTFTSGLGLNLYAFSAYYMGSFLMPFTFFFNVHNMPDALYLLTLIKFGLIGLSAFISFKNMYKKLPQVVVLALSVAFSLMSFLTSQLEIIMWLDVFILLPLIIWGLHRLMNEQKRWLYFISLLIVFIQNYYFGFMIALFLVFYFLARMTFDKWSWHKVLDFVVTSLLAGLSSLIMLLPMYLDLRANNSDALTSLSGLFTENAHLFDLFAKNFVGAYDTTQFDAIPMIYVGMVPLGLAFLFFFAKSIKRRTKFAFLGLLVLFIASFYLQALDLFWQGMHSPNMFLHRYAFLFSLLIILMALESCKRWKEFRTWHLLVVSAVFALFYLATFYFGHYHYLTTVQIILTFLFGLAYFIIGLNLIHRWVSIRALIPVLFVFMVSEAGVNGLYQVQGVQKEWNFASRDYYNRQVDTLAPIAEKINALTGTTFARTDNTNPDTANDGMKYNFNTISQFSSVRNSNSSSIMRQLGFHTDSTYLNLRYPGNTLLMDALFGVKYNINQSQPEKYGFKSVSKTSPLNALNENQEALSLGIFVPGEFVNAKFEDRDETSAILNNQTAFVDALSKTKTTLFQPFYTTSEATSDKITGTGDSVTLTRPESSTDNEVSVTYGITAPAHSQIYLSVPNISYINSNAENTLVTISNVENNKITRTLSSYYIGTNDTGRFINLGTFSKATDLKVTLAFPENSQVSFDTTSFWSLDTQAYSQVMSTLKARSPKTQLTKNGATLQTNTSEKGEVFLSIPYDKGWSAKIDGKTVKVYKAQEGFMKVQVPAGKHTLRLSFFPNGLKTGILCFVLGIVLFITYDFLRRKSSLKK